MDPCESDKALETARPPVVSSDKNGTSRRSQIREVSSRYKSPAPSSSNGPKRCPSPNLSRTSSTSTVPTPKRAISVERKRPSPSTPVRDTTADAFSAYKTTAGIKLPPESLWPSKVRSLSTSFQSDTREKTVSRTPSHKGDTPPPRKRSPLKGKNSVDQLGNSKPVESLRHQWSSRISGKMSASTNRTDFTENMKKSPSLSRPRMVTVTPSVRRLSLDGNTKPLQKSASDLLMLISRDESGIQGLYGSSVDDGSLRTKRPGSSRSSVSRGVSPSRAEAINLCSRGTSPARVRPSSPSRNPQSSTSVLSFIADIKKGQKAANNIEDVHQLRLMYNRHLQWRFANARADAALRSQKAKAERMLYSVLRIIVHVWDSVREKRSELLELKLKSKLYSALDSQLTFLDEWISMDRDHTNSLTRVVQDMQVDIKTLKAAVCSAVDVLRSVGSSLCSILPQAEGMNCLVSELTDVASCEKAMLDECESLLSSIAALQVEECSLRIHLLQTKQARKMAE
ncbi:hypothetical protein OROHE_015677 [Orobanche hederae]